MREEDTRILFSFILKNKKKYRAVQSQMTVVFTADEADHFESSAVTPLDILNKLNRGRNVRKTIGECKKPFCVLS